MEDPKKTKVLEAAIELFRKRGYSAVSMQDIAEACSMAKASIYKLFDSKEDLFTAVFAACHREMLDRAVALDQEESRLGLAGKDKLRRKIEFQLTYAMDHHHLLMDFKEESSIVKDERFIEAWKKEKAALHAWYGEMLIEAYGPPIEPYVWDVVAIFRGIRNVYIAYVRQKVLALPLPELGAFIADRLDAVIREMIGSAPAPVIEAKHMHFSRLNAFDPSVRAATVGQLIGLMEDKIHTLSSRPDEVRQEFAKVAALLRGACDGETVDRTLVTVLAAYLEAEAELRPYVRQLRYLLS